MASWEEDSWETEIVNRVLSAESPEDVVKVLADVWDQAAIRSGDKTVKAYEHLLQINPFNEENW